MDIWNSNAKKIIEDIKDIISLCIQSAVPGDTSHLITTQDCNESVSKHMKEQVNAPVTEDRPES